MKAKDIKSKKHEIAIFRKLNEALGWKITLIEPSPLDLRQFPYWGSLKKGSLLLGEVTDQIMQGLINYSAASSHRARCASGGRACEDINLSQRQDSWRRRWMVVMFKRILPEAVVVDRAQRQNTRLVIQRSWVPSLPVHLGLSNSD